MKIFIDEIEALIKADKSKKDERAKTVVALVGGRQVTSSLTPNEVRAKIKKNFITVHI